MCARIEYLLYVYDLDKTKIKANFLAGNKATHCKRRLSSYNAAKQTSIKQYHGIGKALYTSTAQTESMSARRTSVIRPNSQNFSVHEVATSSYNTHHLGNTCALRKHAVCEARGVHLSCAGVQHCQNRCPGPTLSPADSRSAGLPAAREKLVPQTAS